MFAADQSKRGAIPLWRISAGAFLHFGALAYLVLVPLALLLFSPEGASLQEILRLALRYSAIFLAAIVSFGCLATALCAAVDILQRARRRRAPAEKDSSTLESRQHLVAATDTARRALDHAVAIRISTIAAAPWDHDDPRYQALARDLDNLVVTTAAAIGSVPAERRGDILSNAATAVAHIDHELAALNSERGRAEEARAQAAVRYVQSRYRPSDFSIPAD